MWFNLEDKCKALLRVSNLKTPRTSAATLREAVLTMQHDCTHYGGFAREFTLLKKNGYGSIKNVNIKTFV